MKVWCPKCATTEMGISRKADFACVNGHTFSADEALLKFSDVVSLGKAIAHPTRLRILIAFGQSPELSASEIQRRLGLRSVATARYHVLKLVEHTPPLLTVGRVAKNHGADEQKYELIASRFASS